MPDRQENLAEKKKVSVVVPVYNAAPYLAECIDSLIAQTYQPEEIILVDDGSADESGNICDEYASCYSHIKVIHKKNEGVSAARNTGMDAAGGDYLVFVDSDDFVHHNLLEYYLNHLNENCVPVCRIWEAAEGTEKGMDNYTGETIYALEHFMKFFCADHVNSPCNKIYSVDILRRHHIYFPENMSLGEDLIFNLRYL